MKTSVGVYLWGSGRFFYVKFYFHEEDNSKYSLDYSLIISGLIIVFIILYRTILSK